MAAGVDAVHECARSMICNALITGNSARVMRRIYRRVSELCTYLADFLCKLFPATDHLELCEWQL